MLPLPRNNEINSDTQKAYTDENKVSYLYYHDASVNEILVYNIDDRTLANTIKLSEDGPDGVGRARGLSIQSPNEIWMSPIGRAGSYVINNTGKPADWIPYEWEANQMPDFTLTGNTPHVSIVFDPDYIYIPQRIPMYGSRPETVDHAPIIKMDRRTRKMTPMAFKYPVDYYEREMPVHFTFESFGDKLIFGMFASHDVYLIDKQTGEAQIKNARSRFITEDIKSQAGLAGYESFMRYNASQPDYTAIIPDTFRNLIYRVVILPPEDPRVVEEKFDQLHWTPDRFVIMVCDENMTPLFEQEFPSRLYYPHGIFIDKHGINIPKTHPEFYVSRGKEEEMLYDVFLPQLE